MSRLTLSLSFLCQLVHLLWSRVDVRMAIRMLTFLYPSLAAPFFLSLRLSIRRPPRQHPRFPPGIRPENFDKSFSYPVRS